jgi:3-isopropylmalate dehydrogenase
MIKYSNQSMPQQTTYRIAWLPGDGIGRDVTQTALDVMHAVADALGFTLTIDEHIVGGAALDATGDPLPPETRTACTAADAVFLGAVGGPKWDTNTGDRRPEAGLLALRTLLGTYANLRPVTVPAALADASPLRRDVVADTDVLIVRELTGGIYFGEPSGRSAHEAYNTMRYSMDEVEQIARVAFEHARRREGGVTSVDKANVLAVSQLWREVVTDVHRTDYPDVELNHLYVDNAAMQLVRDPKPFDVVLTSNLFGDILSDLAATFPGSLGLLPSASIGGSVGLFEPVHGSAPDIAGQNIANPIAAILSGAMLLDELGESRAASAIRTGVHAALDEGARTADLWREGHEQVSTTEMGTRIAEQALRAASTAAASA